nr:hypothetical protein [Tanacetum cinerariifolium]
MQSAADLNIKRGAVRRDDTGIVARNKGVAISDAEVGGLHVITESVGGQVTIGEALEAAAISAGEKPIEQSDAAAIQAAEVRATGRMQITPGGVAAKAQAAVSQNTRTMRDEDKTKLGDVLADASTMLPKDKVVTRQDAEGVIGAEVRNQTELSTYPGGVAATMAAAARLNQKHGKLVDVLAKALLELKNKIMPKIIHVIGNGKDVSMWSDNWSDMGHLTQFVTYKDIHDARINEECSVVDMIDDNKWIWPEQWVNKFTQLRNLHVPLLNNEKSDAVKWRKCNGQMIEFSVRDIWWDMKCAQNKVHWWKVIWCNPRKCSQGNMVGAFKQREDVENVNGAEIRNQLELSTYPGGVTATKAAATRHLEKHLKFYVKRVLLELHKVCIQHIWTYRGGRVRLPLRRYSSDVIRELDRDTHFMKIIQAYNQMFAMTSFRAKPKDQIPRVATILAMSFLRYGKMTPKKVAYLNYEDGDSPVEIKITKQEIK